MIIPTIISRLLDPFMSLTVLFILSALQSGMTGMVFIRFLLFFFVVVVAPLVGLLWWAVKTKRVTNYDLSDRKERVRVLLFFFVFLVIDGILIHTFFPFGKLQEMFLFIFLFIFGFFLLTLKWKISGHMAFATLTIGLILFWYGMAFFPIVALLPLLGWLRIKLKRHTMGEVIGGTVYSLLFVFILYILQLID